MMSRILGRNGQIATILSLFVLFVVFEQKWRYTSEPSIAGQYPCPSTFGVQSCASGFDTKVESSLLEDPSEFSSQSGHGSTIGQLAYDEREDDFYDGTKRYERALLNSPHQPTLLILTLTKDSSSYGQDKKKPPRSFQDYINLLISSQLDLSRVSLGLTTESKTEFELFKSTTLNLTSAITSGPAFPRLTILLLKSPKRHTGLAVDREDRHTHNPTVQQRRRSHIAQLRNSLTFHSLRTESQVLWLDADVNYLSPNVIQTMLAHSNSNRAAGIITARCQEGPTYDYDKNAWYGKRPPPSPSSASGAEKSQRTNVAELIANTTPNSLVPLTTVGGTILLIRASLVYRGLIFPAGYVVGTQWDSDGWDGIETEGLCVLARDLGEQRGEGGCWVLGGPHHVGHTNY